ncbi:MAG: CoA transferase [Balneolales bacterium]|nr:CoA transferase [Balneolales bacterium]
MKVFRPLEGLTVVSIEQAVSAPYASCRLADAGARVIKIERDTGDFARQYDEAVNGLATYFVWINRGKESIRLNIKDDADRTIFLNMIDRADVFIQNLAPGALEKIGLHSAALRDRNNQLITVDISGYGEEGDYSKMKAYDNLVQCESGLVDVTGDGEMRSKVGISIADISAGVHAYSAVLEALHERNRTGKGVGIKISMFDCMADWMMVPYLHQEYAGKAPSRTGVHHAAISPYGPFHTRENKQVVIAIQNEREWVRFCETVMKGAIRSDDARYIRNSARVANRDELNATIQQVLQELSHEEVITRLEQGSIAFARLNTVADFARHPQLRIKPVDSEAGPVRIVDRPAKFVGYTTSFERIPDLGEHEEALKKEFTI